MTDTDGVAVSVENERVLMDMMGPGKRPAGVRLTSAQARELARMLRNAADFCDAAGQPHGHA